MFIGDTDDHGSGLFTVVTISSFLRYLMRGVPLVKHAMVTLLVVLVSFVLLNLVFSQVICRPLFFLFMSTLTPSNLPSKQ
jgi:hypothetical protein